MIRRIIVKSNRRIAFRMVFYTSMFTGLFMAYFILSSFNSKQDAQHELVKAQMKIDSLEAQIDTYWEAASNAVPLILPVKAEDIEDEISEFGYRIHPIFKVRKFHYGRDFPAIKGTPVYATAYGEVIEARKSRYGYGNRVIIEHGFGYQTVYAHLHKINVNVGDTVSRGDLIASVGSTGLSTGPHLHYEVVHMNKKVDPKLYSSQEELILLALER